MINKTCMLWDGDEDCNKCAAHGYIYVCPENCPDYYGFYPPKKDGEEDCTKT